MFPLKTLGQKEDPYNQQILQRIETGFNKVLPYAAVTAFVSSVVIYFTDIPLAFMIVDFLVALIFMLLTAFSQKIDIRAKIIIMIAAACFIGVFSFLDGALNSAFITLILLANIVTVMFLDHRSSTIFSFGSAFVFGGLIIVSRIIDIGAISQVKLAYFIVHYVVFILYLIILHVSVYSIRSYLTDNLHELEESMVQANKLAYYDQLTGLPNAYKFKKDLQEIIGHHGFLLMFNLKNLSTINSIYGENTGDQVLKVMVKTILSLTPEKRYMARINGNEFVYWINEEKEEILLSELNLLTSKFYTTFHVPKMNKKLEFTISYTDLNNRSMSLAECYHQGIIALSFAKRNNLSRVIKYNDEINSQIIFEENIKDNLESAMRRKEITLHYQPKVDTAFDRIVGVEALARWNSPIMGNISPAHFIKVIDQANMSVIFGEYIIDCALFDYPNICKKYGDNISLSINISPKHLVDQNFVDYLLRRIRHHQVPYSHVVLEITEDIMIQDIELVRDIFHTLRNRGIEISLDDFGSGYSSLNYLTTLELSELKIDKSFIDQIDGNYRISIMLENIINLSNQYGLRVVSEGVETAEQKEKLVQLGCRIIQGYYYYKPEAL